MSGWTQDERVRRRHLAHLAVLERDAAALNDEPLDRLALELARWQPYPLSPTQRERLRIITRELTRRAER